MTIADRVNRWIHPTMAARVNRYYLKKLDAIKLKHPELFKPIDPDVVRRHKELWKGLDFPTTDKWVTWLSNLSGIVDYRYCPENILYSRIERVLNDCERSGFGCEDKNQFFLYVPHELQAKTYLRFVRGVFYDEEYRWISEKAAQSILDANHGDLIGKVCVHSLGGHGISKFTYKNGFYFGKGCERLTTAWIKNSAFSYVLQERIDQCSFSASFNPNSANSCKIVTLRCPWSGEIKVVKAGMRFGQTTSVFDNLSSGGISVSVDVGTGRLSPVAYNWYQCEPFENHPLTGVAFDGKIHPHFQEMCLIAIKYAAKVPDMNMLSWDMIADSEGKIKVLEVNAASQSSDWLQFGFGSLFGDESENVADWCRTNRKYDVFNHIRTWY